MDSATGAQMKTNPLVGKLAPPAMLVNVPRLITVYYSNIPDASVPAQRVAFGTSGHRGCAFENSFNEWHVLAISQAICQYRKQQGIDGPLFLGIGTHALSEPAFASALEVLAGNGVEVMLADKDEYTPTPTPVISHAILAYNPGRATGLADGIVITPSHNPPDNGGFKYNPPNGGPVDKNVTGWIEARANTFLESGLQGVKRMPFEQARRAATTHRHDYLNAYVNDLGSVLDMDVIRGANISMGVDPLCGAGAHYRMTQELVACALFRAVQNKRPAAGLIHHSDRGSQYCAHDYRQMLDQFGMRASMSRRGNCYDNAPMESFWGRWKG